MNSENVQIAGSLSQKFRLLQQTLNDLSIDATMYHTTLPIHDEASRGLFNALSRIMAISDQVHMSLSLMGEDVRAIETASTTPEMAFWSEQLEDGLEEWMSRMPSAAAKIH